ncbi:MAG: AAA family ATPase [Desulfopila sp.]
MYLAYYQLKKLPFQIACDPQFLWLGEKYRQALASLRYGVLSNRGFLLLTGDVGTGKTTLVNALVNSLGDEVIVAKVFDPGIGNIDFINFVGRAFDIGQEFASKDLFLLAFERFLKATARQKKKVLLVIDEAQRIQPDLLEEIRLLTNIECPEKKLLNIVLVGQNEFNALLHQIDSRALRQRISISYTLEPLDETETGELIRHRLAVAGTREEIFSAEAVREVYVLSQGLPRKIIILCDHCLLTGAAGNVRKITREIVGISERAFRLPDFSGKEMTAPAKRRILGQPENSARKIAVRPGNAAQQAEVKVEKIIPPSAPSSPLYLKKVSRRHPRRVAATLAAAIVAIAIAAYVVTGHIEPPPFRQADNDRPRTSSHLPLPGSEDQAGESALPAEIPAAGRQPVLDRPLAEKAEGNPSISTNDSVDSSSPADTIDSKDQDFVWDYGPPSAGTPRQPLANSEPARTAAPMPQLVDATAEFEQISARSIQQPAEQAPAAHKTQLDEPAGRPVLQAPSLVVEGAQARKMLTVQPANVVVIDQSIAAGRRSSHARARGAESDAILSGIAEMMGGGTSSGKGRQVDLNSENQRVSAEKVSADRGKNGEGEEPTVARTKEKAAGPADTSSTAKQQIDSGKVIDWLLDNRSQ